MSRFLSVQQGEVVLRQAFKSPSPGAANMSTVGEEAAGGSSLAAHHIAQESHRPV
jgi:hypothetical protein